MLIFMKEWLNDMKNILSLKYRYEFISFSSNEKFLTGYMMWIYATWIWLKLWNTRFFENCCFALYVVLEDIEIGIDKEPVIKMVFTCGMHGIGRKRSGEIKTILLKKKIE